MDSIRGIPRRIETRIQINRHHRTLWASHILRPDRDIPIQHPDLGRAFGAIRRLHGQDLGDKKANFRVDGAHLIQQLAVGVDDFDGGAVLPDVVGAQVHENDVHGGGEPGLEERLPWSWDDFSAGDGNGFLGNARCEIPAVPFVRPVVGGAIAAVGARLSADEADLGVGKGWGDVGGVELAGKEGAPAALGVLVSMFVDEEWQR